MTVRGKGKESVFVTKKHQELVIGRYNQKEHKLLSRETKLSAIMENKWMHSERKKSRGEGAPTQQPQQLQHS